MAKAILLLITWPAGVAALAMFIAAGFGARVFLHNNPKSPWNTQELFFLNSSVRMRELQRNVGLKLVSADVSIVPMYY